MPAWKFLFIFYYSSFKDLRPRHYALPKKKASADEAELTNPFPSLTQKRDAYFVIVLTLTISCLYHANVRMTVERGPRAMRRRSIQDPRRHLYHTSARYGRLQALCLSEHHALFEIQYCKHN